MPSIQILTTLLSRLYTSSCPDIITKIGLTRMVTGSIMRAITYSFQHCMKMVTVNFCMKTTEAENWLF